MSKLLESGFESVVLSLLGEMGFTCHGGDAFDPDATGERESYHGAMLPGRLRAAVARRRWKGELPESSKPSTFLPNS